MEAEYIALVHSMGELFPDQWLLEELASHLDLDRDSVSTISSISDGDTLIVPLCEIVCQMRTLIYLGAQA
eukprot:12539330-Ditylum_brightwellii.AAC.1